MRDRWPRDDYERRVDDYWDYRDRVDTYWDHRHREIDDEWRRIDLERENERLRTYSPEALLAGEGVSVDSPAEEFEADESDEDALVDLSTLFEPVERPDSPEPETPPAIGGLLGWPRPPSWSTDDRILTGLETLDQWCQHVWLPKDRFEQHKAWIRADIESSTFDPDVKRELIEQVDALEHGIFLAGVRLSIRRLITRVTDLTADPE